MTARDQRALAELYDRHARLLFGLILRILRSRPDAEDVLQEVFVQAWTRTDTYNASLGSPAGWLIGIARSTACETTPSGAARRSRRRHPPRLKHRKPAPRRANERAMSRGRSRRFRRSSVS